jgi:uncharacterized lipoprotein YddW (UPF0748 family)
MVRPHLLIPLIALCAALAAPAFAQSRRAEMRGAWMGSGYNRDWPAIMGSLKDNGFNALFPNLCIGAMAYYPSKVLVPAPGGTPGRDELAEAVKAAKQSGIELHLWRIDWALWGVPKDTIATLEAAGRLQRNAKGQLGRDDPNVTVDWLCPSNAENRKLEKDAVVEAVRNYDISGIQFDYMRFPNGDYCYCDNCKSEFQKSAKVTATHWPEDVQPGGAYYDQWQSWRRGLITSLADDISRECHRIKPQISVSLAAWPDLNEAHNSVAQEWPLWIKKGILDFICPMDYTKSRDDLVNNQLPGQLEQVRGAIPLYAGLGAFVMDSPGQLMDQIQAARDSGVDGFLAFAYFSGDFHKWLPELHRTVTAGDPYPMPHWSPLPRFTFAGPAAAVKSETLPKTVTAGQQLQIGVTIGPPAAAVSDEDRENAEQAAAVLRQAVGDRASVGGYQPGTPQSQPSAAEEAPRLSGRVVAESPSGATLAVMGAFEGEMGIPRTFRVLAPEGPFRIAVYGTAPYGAGKRDFVTRSILLTGVKPPPK